MHRGRLLAVGATVIVLVCGTVAVSARALPRTTNEITETTRQSAQSLDQPIAKVARSIDATLKMTPEEFKAWVYRVEPDGSDNEMTFFGARPFDCPALYSALPPYPSTRTDVDAVRYSIDGYVRRYPSVPHLGPEVLWPDHAAFSSLAFLNGTVTVPLRRERNGTATVAFGTSIWPDGTKIVYSWVANISLPHNPRLGHSQRIFSSEPVYSTHASRNRTDPKTEVDRLRPRADFLHALETNVGRPVAVGFSTNLEWMSFPDFASDGSSLPYDPQHPLNATIPGIDLDRAAPVFNALQDAYLNQNPTAFAAAVANGERQRFFLPTTGQTVKSLAAAITLIVRPLKSLDSTFANLPVATMAFYLDATVPDALRSTSPASPGVCPAHDEPVVTALATASIIRQPDYTDLKITMTVARCTGDFAVVAMKTATIDGLAVVLHRLKSHWTVLRNPSIGDVYCEDYKQYRVPHRLWVQIRPVGSDGNSCQ